MFVCCTVSNDNYGPAVAKGVAKDYAIFRITILAKMQAEFIAICNNVYQKLEVLLSRTNKRVQ